MKLFHYVKLPHFANVGGIVYIKWLRQCPKGRAGYNCQGGTGCGYKQLSRQ